MEQFCTRCQGPVDGGVCLVCGLVAVPLAGGVRNQGKVVRADTVRPGGRRIWQGLLITAVASVAVVLTASLLAPGPGFATYPTAVIRANAFLDLGLRHQQDGKPGRALRSWQRSAAYFERALALEPGDLQSRACLGLLYYYLGDPKGAVAAEQAVLAQDGRHLLALFNLGWIHFSLGELDQAKGYLNRYLTVVDAERARVEKYRDQGLIDRQIQAVRAMIRP